ncbi:MAG: hypothetical protein CMN85_00035 [Spongiibacteraceae bacterium]|nr:hypothetical protein [Spongiibacteraceae bacterium]
MKLKIISTFFLAFLAAPSVLADYTVDCEGYNSDTSSYVYGECSNGEFEGYDSDTGNYVYGECEIGGDLEAYDSATSVYVYGECDDS